MDMYRIGIDVGGTFTDLVAVSSSGDIKIAKVPSTPKDQSIGLVEGIAALAEELGMSRADLLQQTALVIHGTTVATNALLERKGAKVGMLTTEGFRDVIEQREGLKPDRYNLRLPVEPVLVPRSRRLPITERLRHCGSTEIVLDEPGVEAAVDRLKEEGVNAIAICCLHSYANSANEKRVREIVQMKMPDVYISLSSEVLPQIKEFERFSTTVVNTFVGPILSNYMKRLRERLDEAGYAGDILIMHSHGGLATIEDSIKLGAGCVLSGPAGGIAGSRHAAELMGIGELITFDMGGTSSDIALLNGGQPYYSSDRSVEGTRVALPSIDIHTIGAGGGSIASVQVGGMLQVGPQSAGSDPGPACYSRGGSSATTTDANVVLGYYDPNNFLGGRIRFDGQAADKAIGKISDQLGCDPIAAAHGILKVINTQMAEGIRIVAVRAGKDPRNYTLLSFGGAAGLHITDIARILDIRRVVVPRSASVLSAWGMLTTNLRHDNVRTAVGDIRKIGADELCRLFAEMEAEGRRRLKGSEDLIKQIRVFRSLDMRYGEQIFEINVTLDTVNVDSSDLIEQIVQHFHRRHEELYTYASPDQEVVLVNARVSVEGVLTSMPNEPSRIGLPEAKVTATRRVHLGHWHDVPVYQIDELAPGQKVEGPAILESRTTSVLVRHGDTAMATELGWLDISVG